jgi:predicted glycogen debranching enzyme
VKIEEGDCQNLERALSLEWLEPNGRGGFASGTVAGANTRRYHALLLVARKPPSERVVLVNHLDEWVDLEGHRTPLSTNLYPGAVYPVGYQFCTSFELAPWPTWTYAIGDLLIERALFVPHRRDMVVVRWRRLDTAPPSLVLQVRPMLSGRDYHATHHENAALNPTGEVGENTVRWRPYADLPDVRAWHNGTYGPQPDWYRHVQFPVEAQRGLDSDEDWWSPGELSWSLAPGATATLVLTTELNGTVDADHLARDEQRRRTAIRVSRTRDALVADLWQAADAYLSVRGSGQTIVAGYPWFTDWGRDAFVSLPGLCLVTGRYDIAWQIIEAFAQAISRGMVPNRFPDVGEQPEYNTIDASLWFIDALDRYLAYTGDLARIQAIGWPAVRAIVDGYRHGTRFNIRLDHDGLIAWGEPGAQLTWMDAKVGEWVVTPRQGKPVEIQALWIRALSVAEVLAEHGGESRYAESCRQDRSRAIRSFQQRFWYGAGGYLYDVIDGPDGDDPALRPNQLYAVALCEDLLTPERARAVLDVVEAQLLTPVGLRTLAPTDPRYQAHCEGTVAQRDGAYHQGTVWPFLLGVFVSAWLKVHGRGPAQRAHARQFLDGVAVHLQDACLGQISEIFDGDAPHAPRGCVAQAWSVAEPLRVLVEELDAGPPTKPRRS